MKQATVKIYCVADDEYPEDGERVVGISTSFGYSKPHILTIPHVYWNNKKKRFTYNHGSPLSGFSVEYWFREADLVGFL